MLLIHLLLLEIRLSNLSATLEKGPPLCPNAFIALSKALPFLPFLDIQELSTACASGFFESGSELIDTSPAGSERPTYLLNVHAFKQRSRIQLAKQSTEQITAAA